MSFVWLFALSLAVRLSFEEYTIAIIGGGIGGAATSLFVKNDGLEKTLGEKVVVDLYERNEYLGGRIRSRYVQGKYRVEEGAGILHDSNRYILNMIRKYNLSLEDSPPVNSKLSVAIWDGDEVKLKMENFARPRGTFVENMFYHLYRLINLSRKHLRLVYRYGYFSMRNLISVIQNALVKWLKIYDHLDEGSSFESLKEMTDSLDLTNLALVSGRSLINKLLSDELLSSIVRSMYAQSEMSNGLVSFVSLAGAAFVGSVSSVKGGNSQMVTQAIKANVDNVYLSEAVQKITINDKNLLPLTKQSFTIHTVNRTKNYHAIIIASPIALTNITFNPLVEKSAFPQNHEYLPLFNTWVIAKGLRLSYIQNNESSGREIYDVDKLLTTEYGTEKTIIQSASRKYIIGNGKSIYGMFSHENISPEFLSKLYVDLEHVEAKNWRAFSSLKPRSVELWPKFKLAPFLYYNNAMESLAACMEISSIGAKNVVNLLHNDIKKLQIHNRTKMELKIDEL